MHSPSPPRTPRGKRQRPTQRSPSQNPRLCRLPGAICEHAPVVVVPPVSGGDIPFRPLSQTLCDTPPPLTPREALPRQESRPAMGAVNGPRARSTAPDGVNPPQHADRATNAIRHRANASPAADGAVTANSIMPGDNSAMAAIRQTPTTSSPHRRGSRPSQHRSVRPLMGTPPPLHCTGAVHRLLTASLTPGLAKAHPWTTSPCQKPFAAHLTSRN